MRDFDIVFNGMVHIDGHDFPIEYKATIKADNEMDAKVQAYTLAKKAYLTWDYKIVEK